MVNKNDIIGKRFGRLVVFEFIGDKSIDKTNNYICMCDCGSSMEVNRNSLITGNTQSCGCISEDKRNEVIKKRTGTISKNKFGSTMKIIEYHNANDILVKFLEHGNLVHAAWREFIEGSIRDPYDKTSYGIGFVGEGKYKPYENGKTTIQYEYWNNMMKRCFNKKLHKKHPTYKECSVSEEWHNFQNFAMWFDENYYQIEGEKMCLDKDILVKGNKIYSPDTCVFVPSNINTLFIKQEANRGEYPIGVCYHKRDNKFRINCGNNKGENLWHGDFKTHEEAFITYKTIKKKIVREVANKNKQYIPDKLYEAMIKYEVEITD